MAYLLESKQEQVTWETNQRSRIEPLQAKTTILNSWVCGIYIQNIYARHYIFEDSFQHNVSLCLKLSQIGSIVWRLIM